METEAEHDSHIPKKIRDILDEGRNSIQIHCLRCPSLILGAKVALFKQTEIFLPHMMKKTADQHPEDGETLKDFWVVRELYDFDNVGFSNIVGNIRYLTCADCEIGPIGYHDTNIKNEFLIAVDRVKNG